MTTNHTKAMDDDPACFYQSATLCGWKLGDRRNFYSTLCALVGEDNDPRLITCEFCLTELVQDTYETTYAIHLEAKRVEDTAAEARASSIAAWETYWEVLDLALSARDAARAADDALE